jgi:hypothetical protein
LSHLKDFKKGSSWFTIRNPGGQSGGNGIIKEPREKPDI